MSPRRPTSPRPSKLRVTGTVRTEPDLRRLARVLINLAERQQNESTSKPAPPPSRESA